MGEEVEACVKTKATLFLKTLECFKDIDAVKCYPSAFTMLCPDEDYAALFLAKDPVKLDFMRVMAFMQHHDIDLVTRKEFILAMLAQTISNAGFMGTTFFDAFLVRFVRANNLTHQDYTRLDELSQTHMPVALYSITGSPRFMGELEAP